MRWPEDREQIKRHYLNDGYVAVRSLYNVDEIREILHHLDRYVAEVVPTLPPMDVFYQQKHVPSTIKMLPRMHHHDGYISRMLTDGRLPSIPAYLWSAEAVPRDAAYFNKPAGISEVTPPHQDGYYFHLDPCEAMTLWLALDDVDEQNGCVRYIPGSHREPLRPHRRTDVLGFSHGITDFGDEDLRRERAECVRPGDLIVHDSLTIHRADSNQSTTRSRRALGFVYYSARARVDRAAAEEYQRTLEGELRSAGKI